MAPSRKKNKSKTMKKGGGGNKRIKEIVFDPEARRDYLRGFSERKRQRRAYGLAMQKVKDRKAKLEARKDLRQAEMERIEEAERLKEKVAQEEEQMEEEKAVASSSQKENDDNDNDDGESSLSPDNDNSQEEGTSTQVASSKDRITTTYHDQATQQQWGGDVIVTTSMTLADSDDDEEDEKEDTSSSRTKQQQRQRGSNNKRKSRDEEQEYAGNVEKFLAELKQKMPAKNSMKAAAAKNRGHGGKHGATNMKGIGGAAEMKIAQKALARSKNKGGNGKRKTKVRR